INDSRCIEVINEFTALSDSEDIISYSWDFGDGTTSNEQNISHQFASVGTYTIFLDVIASNRCSNRFTKSIPIYSEPQADFTSQDGVLCSLDPILFTNLTDSVAPDSVITYTWNFNNEGIRVAKDTSFIFEFGGLKDVTLTAEIPGCDASITKSLDVKFGPNTDFEFEDACLGDVTEFNNLSTGDNIVGQTWTFGDGGFSSNQNVLYAYQDIGQYGVSLAVENDLGCVVTKLDTIQVGAIPKAGFIADLACVGAEVQLTDTSRVDSANIVQWHWDFKNDSVSQMRDPITVFYNEADFEVELIATSNFGCADTVVQTINVQPAPAPNFSFQLDCLGELSSFKDETIIDADNPVSSYLWLIEDQAYSVQNPQHTFETPGPIEVTLVLNTSNKCAVTSVQMIDVPALPIPEFSITTACENSPTLFEDQSLDEGDPIISRTWNFDGLGVANGEVAEFVFPEPGSYNVSLTTTSTLGCTAFIGKTIEVSPQPEAGFVPSTLLGPPPLNVNFNNQSGGTTSFEWFLNDNETPFSGEENASILFESIADYDISLVAYNEFGCTDTLTQVIEVLIPETDLILNEVIPVANNGKINIVLKGRNQGTIPINGFDIEINIEDDNPIIERFDEIITKGQPFVHTLGFSLPEESNRVDFICVNLKTDVDEIYTDNNQGCINFTPQFIVRGPFPNPVDNLLRLNVLLPDVNDGITISISDVFGKVLVAESFGDVLEGLNIYDFDVSSYYQGIYLVRIEYEGREFVRRIRKK
ncbi:MAG: PKD domain-containing protein, partial [Cyclobacteriaceae bacterium]